MELLNESIKVCNDNVLAYISRAIIAEKEDRLDLAREDLKTAIQLR